MFRGPFTDSLGKSRPRKTPSGTRRISGTPPRGVGVQDLASTAGFSSPQRAPLKSFIVVIPAAHSVELGRLAERMPDNSDGTLEVIVACAGQPADLATIHLHLRGAHFLLAPTGTSAEDLRVLAISQAVGDIVTLESGVPARMPWSRDRSAAGRGPGDPAPLSVSIVVPVHDAGALLDDTLAAISASGLPRESYELIVVDDASTDKSVSVAARYADTLIRLKGQRRGAAYARNRGVDEARGELVAFVDADVRVRRDTLSKLMAILTADPSVAAVGASSDGTSPDGGVATHYWNLVKQFGSQRHAGFGTQFSASCGVVRRSTLLNAGMFNEWLFRDAGIEDLELGQRLHKAGHRVLLSGDVAVSNMRRHPVREVLGTAWSRSVMLMRTVGYRESRVHARGHEVHALRSAQGIVALMLAALVMKVAVVRHVHWMESVAVALGVLVIANFEIFRFFLRRRGPVFAVAAMPLHVASQAIGAAGLGMGWLLRSAIGDPAPNATMQAFAEMGVQMWPPVPRRP